MEQVEQVESESAVVDEGGTIDSPGRRTGAVEQVEPESAVVDRSRLAWQEFAVYTLSCTAKSSE